MTIVTKKAIPTSLPKEKAPCNMPEGDRQDKMNRSRQMLLPRHFQLRGCRDPRSTSFLCKCDLTKS